MILAFIRYVWRSFLHLNLYKKPSSTIQTTEKELISTRIYVCALSVFVFIITIVSAITLRTVNKIEYSPSYTRFSQLIYKYPDTLHCPCSTIGIPYYTFVSTHIKFHQVCSSSFIQQTWIDMIYTQYNTSSLSSDDFRLTLPFFWQLIAGFCRLNKQTWNDTLASFDLSHIFTPIAISENVLGSQVKTILENQINLAKTKLVYNLLSIRRLTSGNQIVSALATNYYLRHPSRYFDPWDSPKMSPRTFNDCSCLNVEGCSHPAAINDHNGHSIPIPGMINDCLIIDGTLASTLECYYNQTCFRLLYPSPLPLSTQTLLDTSNNYFQINSTIEMLLNELMIDEMTTKIQFALYYSQCHLAYCSYSYTHRFDILFILTTIISIFGGLSFTLEFLAPYIAKLILKWKNRHISNNNVSTQRNKLTIFCNYLRSSTNSIRASLIKLNLFERHPLRTPTNIYREQLFTRIFLVLIIISSLTAGLYIFFHIENQVLTISNPSVDTYQELYKNSSSTLQCRCEHMSIPYDRFVNVTFILHQVCSSDLILSIWLDYLTLFDPIFLPSMTVTNLAGDFRTTGASYFQLLATFCSLAKNNIENAQRIFTNTRFINAYVPSPFAFNQKVQAIIESYIRMTKDDFKRTFDWINIAFTTNSLLTGANTNFHISITANNTLTIKDLNYQQISIITPFFVRTAGSCVCPRESLICTGTNLLYINGTYLLEYKQIFSELPIGCIPLSGFLRSTSTWWYNETYINNIQATYSVVIPSQSPPDIKPLNRSIFSRFENSYLDYLLKEMFIETSINTTDFNQFYNACQPISCSYTVIQRRNIIVALLLLFSVCGGLYEILRILIPIFGKFIFFLIDWWTSQAIQDTLPSIIVRINQLFHLVYKSIININLYKTASTDKTIIRQQRIYTRVYLIFFIICLSVILFYTAIIERTMTRIYPLSSTQDYEHLLNLYSDTISCPCTHISIRYDDLLTEFRVNQFHQVCSTNVIETTLVSGSYELPGEVYDDGNDFRNFRKMFIESLKQLCTLAEESVNNSILIFRDSTMFFNQIISHEQFDNEMNVTLNRFKQKISIEFARTLDLIRTNIQGNALIAVFSTNWKFAMNEKGEEKHDSFHSESIAYVDTIRNTSCTCATSQFCTMSAQIFRSDGTVYYTYEGLKLGCYTLETLLLSSLSCFYSMACIYEFRQALEQNDYDLAKYHNETDNPIQLNSSLTKFNINDTIERLAYEMFIESWVTDISYEKFFNSCAPTYCTHEIYYRFDGIELLTTFLSVYAGLSFGIHFMVPYLIQLIKTILNRARIRPLQ